MKELTLFHSKNTRSAGTLALLEELGADYDVKRLNLKEGDGRKPEYLKINPMGKVPAIVHKGTIVTEQVAIYIYLADLYPKAALAPAIGDPLRGPYLRWMAFYGSCFEPAVMDRSAKHVPSSTTASPYGSFDQMFSTLSEQLEKGPWLLGEKFTALDVLYGSALGWMTTFKLVPDSAEIKAYVERVSARPAIKRAREMDS